MVKVLPQLPFVSLGGTSDDSKRAVAQLEKLTVPDLFMRSAGSETSNLEMGCLACIRYQIQGSRLVLCALFSQLGGYV